MYIPYTLKRGPEEEDAKGPNFKTLKGHGLAQ